MEELIDTSFKKIKSLDKHFIREAISNFTNALEHNSALKSEESDSQFKYIVSNKNDVLLTEPNIREDNTLDSDRKDTSFPTELKGINAEDSESLINNIFKGRDFITSESWAYKEIIKSRIISSDDDLIYLDCIIDIETMIIEQRQFPKSLFSNFKTLKTGDLVLIKINSKPGSFRVDIYPGKGIVNENLFDINDDIQELKGRDLGTKLREW